MHSMHMVLPHLVAFAILLQYVVFVEPISSYDMSNILEKYKPSEYDLIRGEKARNTNRNVTEYGLDTVITNEYIFFA